MLLTPPWRLALAASLAALALTAAGDDRTDGGPAGDVWRTPLPALDAASLERFRAGAAEFDARWVVFPSGGGHWGLGPQSSAQSCVECHRGSGRGRAPDDEQEQPSSLVLRLSMPGTDPVGGPRPHPVYGEQLNRQGVLGRLLEEGDFRVRYTVHTVRFPDGEQVELRSPRPLITALWFGPLGPEARLSLRLARPVFGAGLLEQVPESALLEIQAAQRDQGLQGRLNRVRDVARSGPAAGRFGHKATQPTLRQQAASALMIDMGVNSTLFPTEDCWPAQRRCYRIETVAGPEARDEQLAAIVDYLRLLAPPAQRDTDDPAVRRGGRLFEQVRCASCHRPSLPLADGRRIAAYTDLLLHDLGAGLADGRREFEAGPGDWRTAPLWGIGLEADSGSLLHDGRARSLTEAILWHGGEASASRSLFMALPKADRDALLRFLRSL
jgi:CxxC motif-containing protein (DUF1111 family)